MSKQKVILSPYPRPLTMIMSDEDKERLYDLVDVVWGKDEAMPADEIAKVSQDVYAVVATAWRHGTVDDMPNLRVIMETGGRHPSPKHIDYEKCFQRGIRVLSCAPAYGPMVAEMALGMAIASARGIVDAHNDFAQGDEVYLYPSNEGMFTLFDQPVGFIGFGGLAQNLRPLLAPFRCPVRVYDPWLPDRYIRERGCTPASLEEVLSTSRVIFVLAIPSNENKAMLNRELLSLIRPDAVFALISRAHMVDFDALTELLHERRFRAVIDVFPQEPIAKDHPIRTAPNTILSAHRAGTVWDDMHLIGRMVVDDLESMLAGLPPTKMQVAQPEIVYRLP
ncbi:MAG: NAD(P)-dependent oxidoreductase [Chloroflexota bacterium]